MQLLRDTLPQRTPSCHADLPCPFPGRHYRHVARPAVSSVRPTRMLMDIVCVHSYVDSQHVRGYREYRWAYQKDHDCSVPPHRLLLREFLGSVLLPIKPGSDL